MSKPITNQKQQPTPVVEMDAGKFLHMINVGAQSQVTLFAERISKMGEEVGERWRLVSLESNQLVFENVQDNSYFVADIKKLGRGKVKIDNIHELRIVESKKEGSFKKNLLDLVDAISENDMSVADAVFGRIAHQRFRSNVIPESGIVTTRDGVTRRVYIANSILEQAYKPEIVAAICEAVSDAIKVKRGRIVEAVFGESTVTFPVNELTRRRVVARFWKEQAKNAYKFEGFQRRVQHIASLVSQDKVEEAVQNASEFLIEEQEFCMLTLNEMQELSSNTLATVGCMNSDLADDVGSLLYHTSCRANHSTIIEEWKQTARISECAKLVENVRLLSDSKDFDTDYQGFLHAVFMEDVTTQVAKAKMYLAALKDMKNILSNSEENKDLASSLDNYIVRLEGVGNEPDDATLMEVEELVASVSEGLLKNLSDLKDYDRVPQPTMKSPEEFGAQNLAGEPGEGDDVLGGGALGGAGPALPLGESEEPGEEVIPGAEGDAEGGEGEDEELPLPESKQKSNKVVTESLDLSNLGAKELRLELKEWNKNAERFFAEDGQDSCADHLKACITRANVLKENEIATAFNKILAENTSFSEVDITPYSYGATNKVEINKNYRNIHETHTEGMKATSGAPTGGSGMEKISGKGHSMGKAGEADMNVSCGGVSGAILKGGGKVKATLKKESIDKDGNVICPDCKGHFEPTSCMTESGALCPDCGADISKQLMEALDVSENIKGAGHKMDRIEGGKGVAASTLNKSDGRAAGGKKEGMEGQEGSGVAAASTQTSDGAKVGGKKEGMEGQEGSGVAETQYKSATRGMRTKGTGYKRAALDKKLSEGVVEEGTTIRISNDDAGATGLRDVTITTDKPVDEIVSQIADSIAQEDGVPSDIPDEIIDGTPEGDEMPGEDGEIPGEVIDGTPEGIPGEEGMPGEEPGEGDEIPGEEVPGEGEEIPGEGEEGVPQFGEVEEEGEETEEEEEEEEVSEGKVPPQLAKFIKKKKGESGESEEETEETEETVKEDNDIGSPKDADFDSEKAVRKDGGTGIGGKGAKQMTTKPKFKEGDGKSGTPPARSSK